MQDAISIAIQSMHSDMSRVVATGGNLANLTTAGYKRSVSTTQSFTDYLSVAGYGGGMKLPFPVLLPAVTQTTDHKAGDMKFTGNPMDLAISGQGYFEVSTPTGPAYTRKGSFRLDERGRLVNDQGYALMGQGGELLIGTAQPAIDGSGQITDDAGKVVGQVKTTQFSDAQSMVKIDAGLYQAGTAQPVPTDGDSRVLQGYLENSNVDSTAEMVTLIETMRHFQAMQQVVQGYGDALERAIQKLGEV